MFDSGKPYQAHSMSWVQRLKRVFNIDITQRDICEHTDVKIISYMMEVVIMQKILTLLVKQGLSITANSSCRNRLSAENELVHNKSEIGAEV
ncbi:hypothetical protein KUL42_18990 [Alteromonas sp. KUL42]|nr:hypothetical protein KUL42_18990 [Alteromonas sp. KUL42]